MSRRGKWKIKGRWNGKEVWLAHYESAGASWHWGPKGWAHVFSSKSAALDASRRSWERVAEIKAIAA